MALPFCADTEGWVLLALAAQMAGAGVGCLRVTAMVRPRRRAPTWVLAAPLVPDVLWGLILHAGMGNGTLLLQALLSSVAKVVQRTVSLVFAGRSAEAITVRNGAFVAFRVISVVHIMCVLWLTAFPHHVLLSLLVVCHVGAVAMPFLAGRGKGPFLAGRGKGLRRGPLMTAV